MLKSVKVAAGLLGSLLTITTATVVSMANPNKKQEDQEATPAAPAAPAAPAGTPINFENVEGLNSDGYWQWNYYYLEEYASKMNRQKSVNIGNSWTDLKNYCSKTLVSQKNSSDIEEIYNEFMDSDDASVCLSSKSLVGDSPWKDKNEEEIKQEVKTKLNEKASASL